MLDRRAQLMALQNMRRGQQAPAQSNMAGAFAPVMGAPQPPPQGLGAAVAPIMGPPQQGPMQPARRRGQGRPRPMGGGY